MRRVLVAIVVLIVSLFLAVPSFAAMVDLLTAGAVGRLNGAWWFSYTEGSGTGTFDSFLQIGEDPNDLPKKENIWEWGYNSQWGKTADNPEAGTSANFNRVLQWPNIPMFAHYTLPSGYVTRGPWLEFQLDINELMAGTDSYLSIDDLEIWVSDLADLGDPDNPARTYANWSAAGTTDKIYDFLPGDWVATDVAAYSSGSGVADVTILVPWQWFKDWIDENNVTNPYIYFVSEMGHYTGTYQGISTWGASDGFDEWGHRSAPFDSFEENPIVPEPGTFGLMGLGVLGLLAALRRRKAGAGVQQS